jgi:hypothetical protein
MNKATDRKTAGEPFDSFDYCITFWEGAIENEDEIDLCLREVTQHSPRHVRAADDLA